MNQKKEYILHINNAEKHDFYELKCIFLHFIRILFINSSTVLFISCGGHSSVGRASDCDSECRGFKPRWSPQFYSSFYSRLQLNSRMAGTRTVWKHTMQTERFGFFNVESGGGSKREVEEYVIHPNLVKSLRVGKCVCIKKYPESRAYLVDVNP